MKCIEYNQSNDVWSSLLNKDLNKIFVLFFVCSYIIIMIDRGKQKEIIVKIEKVKLNDLLNFCLVEVIYIYKQELQ